MRAAQSRLASTITLLVLFVQAGTASPLGSCLSGMGGRQDTYHHDPVVSDEHDGTAASDHMAIVTWPDASKDTAPASQQCVATAHCALILGAPVAPGPRVLLTVQAIEEPGPSWFRHSAPVAHTTPPPKA
jgi:hypothetical protein